VALEAAADTAARILLPDCDTLDAVVAGGDRHAVDTVLEDPRLGPLQAKLAPHRLDVPTPDRRVLQSAAELFRALQVRCDETATPPDAPT
jgi:hypothetical protein